MANINNIEISNDTVKLIRRILNFNNLQATDKKDLIIHCFNSLRLDNGMNELDIENFKFECLTAGTWNEEEQNLYISYSNFNPDIPKIISTIFHEFRHCWQYYNKLELDGLTQQNLDGPLTDTYTEYSLQPIEQDAFKFEHDSVCFLAEQLNNEELLNYANNEYNNFLNGLEENKQTLIKQKYNIDNAFFQKIFKFRSNRLTNNEQNPEFEFKFEKYNIQFTVKNNELYYAIIQRDFDSKNDLILSGSIKNDKCFINDFVYPKNDLDKSVFSELININTQIINFYNQKFDKNINDIQFNLKFWKMSKSEHNILINSLKNIKNKNNILQRISDKYLETPITIELQPINNKFIDSIEDAIDSFKFSSIINKILDLETLSETDFLLLKSKCNNIEINNDGKIYSINNLNNDELLLLFQKIIRKAETIEQVFNEKKLKDNFLEYVRFKNKKGLDEVIKSQNNNEEKHKDLEINQNIKTQIR